MWSPKKIPQFSLAKKSKINSKKSPVYMWAPGKDTRSKAGKEKAKKESRIHVFFC